MAEKSAQARIVDRLRRVEGQVRGVTQMVEEIGAHNMSALLKAALHKAHEAKYLSRCKNMEEAEAHFIGCSECLRNMMPLEIYWELSHEMPDMTCELPLHTADRFQKN